MAEKFKYVEFIESNNIDLDKLKQSTQDLIVQFSNDIDEAISGGYYESMKDDYGLIDDSIVEELEKEIAESKEKGEEKTPEPLEEEPQEETPTETPEEKSLEEEPTDKKRQPSSGGRSIPTKKVRDPRGLSMQEIVDAIKQLIQFIFEHGLAGIGGAGGGNNGFSEEQREKSCAIEKFIEEKHDKKEGYTEEDIKYIQTYEGNCNTSDPIQHQYLHQYFLTDKLVEKAWALAYHFGYDFGTVFNPFSGKGSLLKHAPKSAIKIVNDIDFYLEQIALNSYSNTVKCYKANAKGEYDSQPYELIVDQVPQLWSNMKVATPSLFISAPPCLWITKEDLGDYMGAYGRETLDIDNRYFGFIGVPYYLYAIATQLAMSDTDDLVVMIITSDQTANQYLFGEIQTVIEKKDAIEYSPDLVKAYTDILKDATVMDIYQCPLAMFDRMPYLKTEIIVLKKK